MAFRERLARLPHQSGVYLFKDNAGDILYVGKAKSLRNRVRSYFRESDESYKARMLRERVDDFEFVITSNEVEAIILENNLIKKHQPPFNIRLKDDRTYPYLKIDLTVPFPPIRKTRVVKNDGSLYFGPYTSGEALDRTLKVLLRLFPVRMCKRKLGPEKVWQRACLNYHIKRCLGPCIGAVSEAEYGEMMEQIILFLQGKQGDLRKRIEGAMKKAAAEQRYEKAAEYRDALVAMDTIQARQEVVWHNAEDKDIVGLAQTEDKACIQLFQIRYGRLIGREHFFLEGVEEQEPAEILRIFLQQYYYGSAHAPRKILVPEMPAEADSLQLFLQKELGHKVELFRPQRGKKARILNLARENAEYQLEQEVLRENEIKRRQEKDMKILQKALNMQGLPAVIEGFDISNLQGKEAVGSMVVFVKGRPSLRDYRRFKIKTVLGSDDVGMLTEILSRRLLRLKKEESRRPDLILIDGGKGQVNACYKVLAGLGFEKIHIVGLAEREEELFLPNKGEPVVLGHDNKGLQLLQRVRDEAHRFALGYHRSLRLRSLTHSLLEDIPGIGPQKRQALLEHFGSLAAIRQGTIKELATVPGISRKLAQTIKNYLEIHLQN